MTIERNQHVLLELFELAVTWPELEYSETPTIAPEHWMRFVESHRWADPDHVERIFSIATDVVMTATRATKRWPAPSKSDVGPLEDPAPLLHPEVLITRRGEADTGSVAAALLLQHPNPTAGPLPSSQVDRVVGVGVSVDVRDLLAAGKSPADWMRQPPVPQRAGG